jgi:hypothetical protein
MSVARGKAHGALYADGDCCRRAGLGGSGLGEAGFDPEVLALYSAGMGGLDVICEQQDELRTNGRGAFLLFIPKTIIKHGPLA